MITAGPWAGGRTPDLNGLFLRGGNEDNVLEMEDSQLQDHEHTDGGHSHSCSASSTAAPHSHLFARSNDVKQGGCHGCLDFWVADASEASDGNGSEHD